MFTYSVKSGGLAYVLLCMLGACALLVSGCASDIPTPVVTTPDHIEHTIEELRQAAKDNPTESARKIDYLIQREQKIRELLKAAVEQRAKGEIDAASELYGRILRIDPVQAAASSGLMELKQDARYLRQLSDGEAFLGNGRNAQALVRAKLVLDTFPHNVRAIALRDAARDAMSIEQADRSIRHDESSILDSPVTLDFTDASLRSIFAALSKSTGLNVLFDRDVKQDARATLMVRGIALSDAIDLVMLQNRLRKRVINGNTLMIYPVMAGKSEEYDDMDIRTFQISNADIKYLAGMLKTMLRLKEISADVKTGILIIRDTPENLRIAERLIASYDVPDPEIMLEVEVLEVIKSRNSNLGIAPPGGITISTPLSSSGMTVGALQRLSADDLITTPLSGSINFKLSKSDTNVLASPRIRVRNREQAKIMIGDRIPTVTNTVTPAGAGPPIVTGHVTYQDVGLKLDFESQVYANSEVGIRLSLEVSNIVKVFTDNNGGRAYQIGTRNASTSLRLKDGETQILGGLISDHERNASDLLPGLGDLPLIGRLFGNNDDTSTRSEIILAITPHIIRNLPVRAPDVKDIYTGTYNGIRERPILAEPGTHISSSNPVSGDPDAFGAEGGMEVNAAAPGESPAPAMRVRTGVAQ